MRNIKMVLAYDGTDFHGWQTQPGQRTVQEELQQRLRRVLRHPVSVIASGRTDAGVHAAGQVVNLQSDRPIAPERLVHAVNQRLPADMRVLRAREVPASFHATRSAVSKLYRYRLCNTPGRTVADQQQRYVYTYRYPLDIQHLRRAAAAFVGTHDFKAFAARGAVRQSYERTIISCEVAIQYDELHISVQGNGFLYNQVRNMVGTLLEIGRGRWPPDVIPEMLASRERERAGPTAPARGLSLQWVQYPADEHCAALTAPTGQPADQ